LTNRDVRSGRIVTSSIRLSSNWMCVIIIHLLFSVCILYINTFLND
jgi:hypothetical protein